MERGGDERRWPTTATATKKVVEGKRRIREFDTTSVWVLI